MVDSSNDSTRFCKSNRTCIELNSWICCRIWENPSLLVRSIAHQRHSRTLVHIAARSLCTCAQHFCNYEGAHTSYASAVDRRSPTLERTRAESGIIIASSTPALDHKHQLAPLTDQRIYAESHITCTRAQLCRLHQNEPTLEILPNLCLVRFMCFCFVFNFAKQKVKVMLNSEVEAWIHHSVIFMLIIVVGCQILPTAFRIFTHMDHVHTTPVHIVVLTIVHHGDNFLIFHTSSWTTTPPVRGLN